MKSPASFTMIICDCRVGDVKAWEQGSRAEAFLVIYSIYHSTNIHVAPQETDSIRDRAAGDTCNHSHGDFWTRLRSCVMSDTTLNIVHRLTSLELLSPLYAGATCIFMIASEGDTQRCISP
jgi:hypothetical protein